MPKINKEYYEKMGGDIGNYNGSLKLITLKLDELHLCYDGVSLQSIFKNRDVIKSIQKELKETLQLLDAVHLAFTTILEKERFGED